MKLIKELLMLREYEEGEIPPRIRRVMRDGDITYDAKDLEDLKKKHAEHILRNGRNNLDTYERALSHALGMHGMSDDELHDIAYPKENGEWEFHRVGPGRSDLIYTTKDGKKFKIEQDEDAHNDEWLFIDADGDSEFGDTITDVHWWVKKQNIPMPTDDQLDDMLIN